MLPATTQLEHFDIHGCYGHLYVQTNEPAIAPLAEAKTNNDVFRLLAKRLAFEPELFEVSDEQLAAEALKPGPSPDRRSRRARRWRASRWSGSSDDGAVRLNLPKDYAPFAEGGFATPSGKCELYSARPWLRMASIRCRPTRRRTRTRRPDRDLAAKYPLQMLSPPAPSFLNSTFVNVDDLRKMAGEPTLEMSPRTTRRHVASKAGTGCESSTIAAASALRHSSGGALKQGSW